MKNRLTLQIVLFSAQILMLFAPSVLGQDKKDQPPLPSWREPYTDVTKLGGFLEPNYKEVLSQCGIAGVIHEVRDKKEKLKGKVGLSSIPKVLQDSLQDQLNAKVWSQDNRSLARLFAYIYETRDIQKAQFQEKWLITNEKAALESDPSTMLPPGTSSILYAHNCSGIIKLAIDSNAGVTIPLADIKAALNSEYSGTKKLMLGFVRGEFKSPFGAILDSSASSAERLTALLTLWDWYGRNPGRVGKENHIVNSFDGITLYKLLEQKRDTEGKVTLQASSSIPFFSAKGSVESAISEQNYARVSIFSTAAFKRENDVPNLGWETIPTVASIAKEVKEGFLPVLDENPERILQSGDMTYHTQTLVGVPKSMCRDIWTLDSVNLGGATELKVIEAKTVNGLPSCAFRIGLRPDDSVFNDSGKAQTLTFALKTRVPVGDQPLVITPQAVSFVTSGAPILEPASPTKVYGFTDAGAGSKDLSWSDVGLVIRAKRNDLLDWGKQPKPSGPVEVLCKGRSDSYIVTPSMSLNPHNKIVTLNLTFRAVPAHKLDIEQPAAAELCSLKGTVSFIRPRKPGVPLNSPDETVEVPLPERLEILFPRIKPADARPTETRPDVKPMEPKPTPIKPPDQ